MAATKYTYSISGDFPNAKVSLDRLSEEIQTSPIVTALDYVNAAGDDCDIWFKDALSGGDETLLDGIVAAHSGEPLPEAATPIPTIVDGYTTTTSLAFKEIRAASYNEQSSDAQRSLLSLSANDAAAGTGARKVRITYFTAAMAGPKYEIVTMNGTTPVDTVATDICYVERMDVVEVGSLLSNVGNIYLKGSTGGGGVNVATIVAGDGETNWCHHYVAADKRARIVAIYGAINSAFSGELHIRASFPTNSLIPETTVAPVIRLAPGVQGHIPFEVPIDVQGPARVILYARPGDVATTDWTAGFGYYEEG